MKLALSLTLSFLLFAFITKLPLAFSNDDVELEPVLDTKGNPLVSGVEYYIITGGDSGLKLAKTGELVCPVTVIYGEVIQGMQVIFSRKSEENRGNIFVGTPLNIHFPESEKPRCAESSTWLVYADKHIDKNCVGIGGNGDYPNMKILRGNFNIQKNIYGIYGHYKLQFRLPQGTTWVIGTYNNHEHEGGSRLILTKQGALDVTFVRASSYDINNDGIIKSVA